MEKSEFNGIPICYLDYFLNLANGYTEKNVLGIESCSQIQIQI